MTSAEVVVVVVVVVSGRLIGGERWVGENMVGIHTFAGVAPNK